MLSVPLVAHYIGPDKTGEVRRLKSLRVIAITGQNVMLVLSGNKLIPVHQPIPGLTLELIEEYVPPAQQEAVADVTNVEAKKPVGRPKKVDQEPAEVKAE